jgi:hypothetical protein
VPAAEVLPNDNDAFPDRLLPYYFNALAEKINARVAMVIDPPPSPPPSPGAHCTAQLVACASPAAMAGCCTRPHQCPRERCPAARHQPPLPARQPASFGAQQRGPTPPPCCRLPTHLRRPCPRPCRWPLLPSWSRRHSSTHPCCDHSRYGFCTRACSSTFGTLSSVGGRVSTVSCNAATRALVEGEECVEREECVQGEECVEGDECVEREPSAAISFPAQNPLLPAWLLLPTSAPM